MLKTGIIKFFFSAIFLIQIFRLFYICFFYKENLEKYTVDQYTTSTIYRILRSPIYDRNGLKLAENKKIISVCCAPSKNHTEDFYNFLEKNYNDSYKKIISKKDKHFSYIKRKITESEENIFKKNYLNEVFFLKEYERVYPYDFLSPFIGSVDTEMSGISGLEFYLNNFIEGFVINNKDNLQNNELLNETVDKKEVFTTIDAVLSYKILKLIKDAREKYKSEYISAIVMDSENGDILSMVQYPYYDSRNEKLNNFDYQKPFPITDCYEMGSIFKAFSALACIDEGVVDFEELIDCKGSKSASLKGIKINTWKAHDEIPFWKVIRESNNIGIAQVAMRIDKKLYDHYLKMGFSKKTGIELPGEASGQITNPKKWSNQSIISLSYGYEISCSLLQLVSAWSIFSENGERIIPRILFSTPIKKFKNLYKDESVQKTKNILEYTEERIPKIYKKGLADLKIYGKTGTANIIENGIYNQNKNTYVFVGHIEKKNKRYVIGVYVRLSDRSDIYSNTVAQPLFFEIAKRINL